MAAGAADTAVCGAVAGGKVRGLVFGMADRKRPVVLVRQLGQDLGYPGSSDGGEPGGRLGPLRGDIVPLARVGGDVEQAAFVVEAVLLASDAGAPAPVVDEMPVGPSAGCPGAGLEQRLQARAVDRMGRFGRDSGQVGESRQDVDGGRYPVDVDAGLDRPRPAHEQGRPHAALVGRSLAALHAAVPAPAVGAVVRQVDDDRVVGEVQVVEVRDDPTDVPVDVLHHREGGARVVEVLLLRVAVTPGQRPFLEAVPPAVGHLHRAVGRVVGDPDEERLGSMVLDEPDGAVGEVVGDVTVAPDEAAVVVQRGVEVVPPVARGEAVELVESPGVGMVGRLRAVVPLAEGRGGVARVVEDPGDRRFVQVEPLSAPGSGVDAGPRVVAAGQEFRARRRADRADEEPSEGGALSRQRVDVRRADVDVAVEAQVSPALVVGQKEDDVGPRRRIRRPAGGDRRGNEREEVQTTRKHGGGPLDCSMLLRLRRSCGVPAPARPDGASGAARTPQAVTLPGPAVTLVSSPAIVTRMVTFIEARTGGSSKACLPADRPDARSSQATSDQETRPEEP